MQIEDVKHALSDSGYDISNESRLGNDTGTQLHLTNEAIVNVFDNGTVSVQGKNSEPVKQILGLTSGTVTPRRNTAPRPANSSPPNRKVFVVYGHDSSARDQLDAMLRRWKLEPLLLDKLPSEGMTIIEKLEKYRAEASYAVVLATPDDQGHRAGHPDEIAHRARQNVVLELGMLLSFLGRSRVAILLKAQESMEKPSDIQGLVYIPFKDHINDAGVMLAKELSAQGLSIDIGHL